MKKEKRTKRGSEKYPALKPELNLKTRYEEIADCDYLDQLSDKEKAWLNNFNEEYVNASFNHDGKILHSTPELRKACRDRNNSRNRDILTQKKAQGLTVSTDDVQNNVVLTDYEDYLITMVGSIKKVEPKKKKKRGRKPKK